MQPSCRIEGYWRHPQIWLMVSSKNHELPPENTLISSDMAQYKPSKNKQICTRAVHHILIIQAFKKLDSTAMSWPQKVSTSTLIITRENKLCYHNENDSDGSIWIHRLGPRDIFWRRSCVSPLHQLQCCTYLTPASVGKYRSSIIHLQVISMNVNWYFYIHTQYIAFGRLVHVSWYHSIPFIHNHFITIKALLVRGMNWSGNTTQKSLPESGASPEVMLLSMTAAYIEILPVLTTNQPLPSTDQKSIKSNPNPQQINRSPRELHHCPNNPRSSPAFQAECQRMRQDSMFFSKRKLKQKEAVFYKTFQIKALHRITCKCPINWKLPNCDAAGIPNSPAQVTGLETAGDLSNG